MSCVPQYKSYKKLRSFDERSTEAQQILKERPDIVPVIIEKTRGETLLPPIDKRKFLISKEATMSTVIQSVRRRLDLHQNQTIFLLIADAVIPSASSPINQVYQEYKDEDGFLYIKYAAQEVYG